MKKLLLLITLGVAVVGGWWWYQHSTTPHQLSEVMQPLSPAPASAPVNTSLTQMLHDGIMTKQGLLSSQEINNGTAHIIMLNHQQLPIKAVSEIELVQAFIVNQAQVIVVGFDQGGNQCSRQYQIISISDNTTQVSPVFGNCLPLTRIIQTSESSLVISMPQNNPYLGSDVQISYRYHNGKVNLITKLSATQIKHKYAKFTPQQILQIATHDGCYMAGVLLEDNACDNGRKYCVMFNSLKQIDSQDTAYQTLKSFCNR